MIDVLLAEDVRAQDAAAVAAGTSVAALMERAGGAVARVARAMLGGMYGKRIAVVCGKGNNGGDGLVAARILDAAGASVAVVLLTSPDELGELSRRNLQGFRGRTCSADELLRELSRSDLVIDAIFGVGLSRAPAGVVADAIEAMGSTRARILSVDVPSGVDADTGAIPGAAVRAERTVTFSGMKPGLVFLPGCVHAGIVEVADIGAPAMHAAARALGASDVALPVRRVTDHKRSGGTVLIVAGSRAMPGAAALVAGATVHAGAGLTTLCAPASVCAIVAPRVPEITTIPMPDDGEGALGLKTLDAIEARLPDVDALAIGPGLGRHPDTAALVRAIAVRADVPLVVDADGINAFAGDVSALQARRAPTILTPHLGEVTRIVSESKASIEGDRLGAARRLAKELNVILVLKGRGTVVTDGDEALVNMTGGESLAQGGTGDVLTGIVSAFVGWATSRDEPLLDAVGSAVWLHGRAADRIASRVHPHPANATALIDELGPAMHEVAHA